MGFIEQFEEHLEFLKRSCRDFDTGHPGEGRRMAVSLRVLFHDTKRSTSLLTHLGIKGSVKLLSTFEIGHKRNDRPGVLPAFMPVWVESTGNRNPPLGDSPRQDLIPVNDWWNEVIMNVNHTFSRKDVILSAANRDGGAHTIANPDRETQELIRGVGTVRILSGNEVRTIQLDNHHLYLIRQFSHEVLNSPD